MKTTKIIFNLFIIGCIICLLFPSVLGYDYTNVINAYLYQNCSGIDLGNQPKPLTFTGTPTNYSFILGSGCSFSGDDYLVNTSYLQNGVKTVEFWINKTSTALNVPYCPISTGWGTNQDCLFTDTSTYSYSYNNSVAIGTPASVWIAPISLNATHLITTVYNGTHMIRYIDGVIIQTSLYNGTQPVSNKMTIGAREDFSAKFSGLLSRVTTFNVIFNTSMVIESYNNGSGRNWITYNNTPSTPSSDTFNITQISDNQINTSKYDNLIVRTIIVPNQNTNMTTLNKTSIIWYSLNTTLNNGCAVFYQSRCVLNGNYINKTMTLQSNLSNATIYNVSFFDNDYYAGYYPYDYSLFSNIQHTNYSLYKNNNIRFYVYNFSTSINYYLNMEFMGINTSSSNLLIYYCNNTYNSGNPQTSPNCELIDSFLPTGTYSHSHNNSKHQVIPITISTIGKTQNSSFIFVNNGKINNAWLFGYIINNTYDNTSFKIGNYDTWINTNYIFDIHIHPYTTTGNFRFYTEVNINGTLFNSTIKYLFYNVSYLPPSAVDILKPNCSDQYTIGSNNNIISNWTQSQSQLNLSIQYTLSYSDKFNILQNNIYTGNNTYYIWNSSLWNNELSGNPNDYYMYVISTDGISQDIGIQTCYFNICENNWELQTQPCVSNSQLQLYTDSNNCNEKFNIPNTNGTYKTCVIPVTDGEQGTINALYSIALVILIAIGIYFKNSRGNKK